MIKLTEKEIDIATEADAAKHPAFSKEDTAYNDVTKKLKIKQKEISGKDWRLVHDGEKVICLLEGQGVTYTLEKCIEFKTEAEALEEITKLGLVYEDLEDEAPGGDITKNGVTDGEDPQILAEDFGK